MISYLARLFGLGNKSTSAQTVAPVAVKTPVVEQETSELLTPVARKRPSVSQKRRATRQESTSTLYSDHDDTVTQVAVPDVSYYVDTTPSYSSSDYSSSDSCSSSSSYDSSSSYSSSDYSSSSSYDSGSSSCDSGSW